MPGEWPPADPSDGALSRWWPYWLLGAMAAGWLITAGLLVMALRLCGAPTP